MFSLLTKQLILTIPSSTDCCRNRGPLFAPRFLWYRFALFTTKTAALRSAAVEGRYIFAAPIARKVSILS